MARSRTVSRPGLGLGRWSWALLVLPLLLVPACDGDTLLDPDTPPPVDPGEPGEPGEPGAPRMEVSIQVQVPDRMELSDSIQLQVTALDAAAASAIRRVGHTVLVFLEGASEPQAFSSQVNVPEAGRGDTITASFTLSPEWLSPADLPNAFEVEFYGWAENARDDCRAAVPDPVGETFPCRTLTVGGSSVILSQAAATLIPVLGVPGRTTAFPTSSMRVGDLQVDTARGNLFISNRLSNVLHVFRPETHSWGPDVPVGAEPWGLHLNRTGDTLVVANSGGTSVSHVDLTGTPREVVSRRIQTRNTPLFEVGLLEEEVEGEVDEDEVPPPTLAGDVRFLDFSDRPQFLAQDAAGRILYSTRPTVAAPLGTVRIVEREAGWEEHETRILVRVPLDTQESDGTMLVANVDSIIPFENGLIEIWDHRPGFPGQNFRSGIRTPVEAAVFMANETPSDIVFRVDRAWNLEAISFADTTYVAASQDRNWVAFGDGGQPDVGRVVIWHSGSSTISNRLTVADLVGNASERVRALELNRDGSLGIARGAFGTYFFSRDLRLRGTVPEEGEGGGGAALHPDHPNTPAPGASSPQTLAFTLTGDRMLRILDTVHYTERGRLPVRDALAGPMRITPPLATDNNGQGRNCTGADCVVAKLFAVTTSGGVLVVDIRGSHIGVLP